MKTYEDIINLPYKKSTRHKPMPVSDRAAQFSPFAALTGYDEEVEEAARITDEKIELSEDRAYDLDVKMNLILQYINEKPAITVTYFVPDKNKSGGKYVEFSGRVRTFNEYEKVLVFTDKTEIKADNICKISGDFFKGKIAE